MACIDGVRRHDADEISPEEALALYQRDQLLWLRLPKPHRENCSRFSLAELSRMYGADPEAFKDKWHVENCGELTPASLTPDSVLGDGSVPGAAFYVSCILDKALHQCLEPPELLRRARHDGGAWLFIG